eukprot:scaffold1908_cov104-Isochrysis_galbana.AAC.12
MIGAGCSVMTRMLRSGGLDGGGALPLRWREKENDVCRSHPGTSQAICPSPICILAKIYSKTGIAA